MAAQGLHRLAIGDGEDPGRKLAFAVEGLGPVPNDHERVVENLFHQVRSVDELEQETGEAVAVAPIELLERIHVLGADTLHQESLAFAAVPGGRSTLD